MGVTFCSRVELNEEEELTSRERKKRRRRHLLQGANHLRKRRGMLFSPTNRRGGANRSQGGRNE